MKLLKSNYENKEVINHLKNSFSIMESSGATFSTSEFIEADFKVYLKYSKYNVEITKKGLDGNNLVIENDNPDKYIFDNRIDAIKCILKTIKIIK